MIEGKVKISSFFLNQTGQGLISYVTNQPSRITVVLEHLNSFVILPLITSRYSNAIAFDIHILMGRGSIPCRKRVEKIATRDKYIE